MRIWNQGIDLTIKAYQIVSQFPKEEQYGLKSQIRRAVVSIPSNIAEGCSRTSEKEFKHYLEISLGSSFEVETDLIIAQRLGMISKEEEFDFLQGLHVEQRQLNALISRIRKGL